MDLSENLYDEFGNYIGPDLSEQSASTSDFDNDSENENLQDNNDNNSNSTFKKTNTPLNLSTGNLDSSQEVVLHEDKSYYLSSQQTYPEAETVTQLEDTQPIEVPIINPIKTKLFQKIENKLPKTNFSYDYLTKMMDYPDMIRNICFIGQLHHGKTSFMDLLIKETHDKKWILDKEVRYTDVRLDEQTRGISIKATPMSLILESSKGKSYLINTMDCPGHVNFSDETTAALRICDGTVIFIDAGEGVLKSTERCIIHSIEQGIPICVVITKMDRLILELKLPPKDAYHKLNHLISEINLILTKLSYPIRISPELGNVCFSSSQFEWCFTLKSFAAKYTNTKKEQSFSTDTFSKFLWGDYYFNRKTRSFTNRPTSSNSQRAFVEFILEPIYKIYSHTIGLDTKSLPHFLTNINVKLKKRELNMNSKSLIILVCKYFFGNHSGFVDMIINNIPSPKDGAAEKIRRIYSGDLNTNCSKSMLKCITRSKHEGNIVPAPQMVNIVKIYPRPDCSGFDSFGRVMSGLVRVGDHVRVLREGYSLDDDEDMSIQKIKDIWVYQARYRIPINQVTAGNWALFSGIDTGITKTATITSVEGNDEACIFRPLRFDTSPVVKVAIEPLKPSELPKMLDALRAINNTYPISYTKVEESGEHIILGTGELYLDCVLHDLRELYSNIEIKVADPVVTFCETVLETSSISCFASTPNGQNKITMICEPLDTGIAHDIENMNIRIDWPKKKISDFFETKYKWDILAARSIWAFGPNNTGPNILQDDTLPTEVDKTKLSTIKSSIIQGYQWGTREGPLCDEPIRNCRFKIINAEVSDNPIHRGAGQIIPTARRVAYSAFLLATPRLMEPVYFVEIQAPIDCITPIYNVLGKRRGFVISESARPGTPFFIIQAYIPVIDSFGFETDLRTHTLGQAFCTQVFDHWEHVPGDPLDRKLIVKQLEPSPINELAREFLVKTRRRKGLAEDVSIYKFFDDEMLVELADNEAQS